MTTLFLVSPDGGWNRRNLPDSLKRQGRQSSCAAHEAWQEPAERVCGGSLFRGLQRVKRPSVQGHATFRRCRWRAGGWCSRRCGRCLTHACMQCLARQTKRVHLEDVDGGLVDGAHDGAAGVDCVAHGAHHDGRRARVQPARRLVLIRQPRGKTCQRPAAAHVPAGGAAARSTKHHQAARHAWQRRLLTGGSNKCQIKPLQPLSFCSTIIQTR